MKNTQSWFTPFKTKIIAGMHIFLQIALPVAPIVNPVTGHAKTHAVAQPTTVYTLRTGETVASVAEKHHLSVQSLRELNQLRTFARGFDNLQAGDELDVPRTTASTPHDMLPPSSPSTTLQTAAGLVSRVASARDHEAMTSTVFSLASNEVSEQIQRWLEQVGTAQIQLALNKESGLTNSQFDMLIPLSEREDRLFFSQQSLHRTDDRTQGNVGFGYRAFHNTWMVGGNTFFDYDLSRGHKRMGTGIEYWRDYLKFGANSYLRLSNWQNSPDRQDYTERPANGWDIRAQAWLPALPQLGGELIYEQYYGQQVALFSKDNHQRNPHAITVGVNYTPFPLLTLNAARSLGASGRGDTRVGIQLRYQPNETWRHQTDPAAAQQMHSLAADRHALIERNNQIVLNYRKKVVIRLQAAPLVTGYAGEEKPLGVVVNSQYGLDKINWSAAALVAAGGEIVQKSAADYSVILPDYQTEPGSSNTYTLRSVAVDKQGNTSPAAETQVTVVQGTINTTTSLFIPAHSQLLADGKTQLQLVLKVNDSLGKPVDIPEEDISIEKVAKLRGNITSTISSFTRRAPGEYVATLTAGTRPENFTLTPFARNRRFAAANIILTEDNASARIRKSDLIVVKDNAKADGIDTNSIKATVTDIHGNVLADQTVSFSADNGATIISSGTTGDDGSVTATLTNTTAGQSNITATVNTHTQHQALTFVADSATAQIASGHLVVIKDNAKANGVDENSVKATVTDAEGNPLAGQVVRFSADNGATITASGTTGSDGSVTVTLTNTSAGQSSVIATVNGSVQHQMLTFDADSSTAQIASGDLVVVTDSARANGIDTNTVKATVTDGYGNRVANFPVDFSADNSGTVAATGTTDASGEVIMVITSTKAGQSTVTATVDTSTQRQTLSFVADDATAQIAAGDLVVIKDTAKANGVDANSVKATVTDVHGNLLPGQRVSFHADNSATIAASGTTGSDGSVTVTLTSKKAGASKVTATINGSSQSQTLSFVANAGTARIISGDLLVVSNNALANGSASNSVKATVRDEHGNILSGQKVSFTADNSASIAASGTTGSDGSVIVTLTSKKAGASRVTATINGSSQSQTLTFVANAGTARIISGDL
ncbi:Ig-like domain-containing protein, partial [Vagococcus sp. WN89Y]|uniref:Ig-like domain-containing protein n=1 Tax=Vagococcus sp. WN89Y TaxID=3457258 RepID=UPI003FCE2212